MKGWGFSVPSGFGEMFVWMHKVLYYFETKMSSVFKGT